MHIKWKKSTKFTNHKIDKRRKGKKTLLQRYICVHPKLNMEKHVVKLRATLDEGPRSRDQWIQAILLVESFKLVPTPLEEGPRPKKWQIEANMAPVLEGKSIGSDRKTVLKGELLIWRTKNQARDPGTLQLKDSICFTWVQIGSYEIGPWTLV